MIAYMPNEYIVKIAGYRVDDDSLHVCPFCTYSDEAQTPITTADAAAYRAAYAAPMRCDRCDGEIA